MGRNSPQRRRSHGSAAGDVILRIGESLKQSRIQPVFAGSLYAAPCCTPFEAGVRTTPPARGSARTPAGESARPGNSRVRLAEMPGNDSEMAAGAFCCGPDRIGLRELNTAGAVRGHATGSPQRIA